MKGNVGFHPYTSFVGPKAHHSSFDDE